MAEKANEIVAIPGLLAMLELKGAVAAMDAMDCQKAIARQIAEAEVDDVLALKDNHPTLCGDVRLWLDTEAAKGALPARETVEKDHGRIEIRRHILGAGLDWPEQKAEWAGLSALGRVESTRIIGDKTTVEHRHNDPDSTKSLRRRKRLASLNDAYRSVTRAHSAIALGPIKPRA